MLSYRIFVKHCSHNKWLLNVPLNICLALFFYFFLCINFDHHELIFSFSQNKKKKNSTLMSKQQKLQFLELFLKIITLKTLKHKSGITFQIYFLLSSFTLFLSIVTQSAFFPIPTQLNKIIRFHSTLRCIFHTRLVYRSLLRLFHCKLYIKECKSCVYCLSFISQKCKYRLHS